MKERESNFELLRIIAMNMIIGLHYFGYCQANSFLTSGINYHFYHLMESVCICGVNVFVMITGFFSVRQNNLKINKILSLLIDVIIWGTIGYLFMITIGQENPSIKDYIKIIIPYLWGGRWFVSSYIILLLLIPYLNKCILSINRQSHEILIFILVLLFSLWPSFLPGPPIDNFGYGFTHFILLYVISTYIRLYVSSLPSKKICIILFIVSTVIVYFSSIMGIGCAYAYNYIFVIIQAISIILYFSQIHFQSSKINILASCAFGVFLIHTDGFFSKIYDVVFKAHEAISGNIWMLTISFLCCLPLFYLFSFVLEYVKKRTFDQYVRNRVINYILKDSIIEV